MISTLLYSCLPRSTRVESANSITYADTAMLGSKTHALIPLLELRYSSELSGSRIALVYGMRVLRVVTRRAPNNAQ